MSEGLSLDDGVTLQAAISSRCQAVLQHALKAKTSKNSYSSRPVNGSMAEPQTKRQKVEGNQEEQSSDQKDSLDISSEADRSFS